MDNHTLDLEQKLWELHSHPEQLDEVLQILTTTELYCLGEVVENVADPDGSDLILTSWEDVDGNTFIPCFTSYDNMGTILEEDTSYVLLQGHDLFTLVNDDVVIINPELSNELVLHREDLNKLARH